MGFVPRVPFYLGDVLGKVWLSYEQSFYLGDLWVIESDSDQKKKKYSFFIIFYLN